MFAFLANGTRTQKKIKMNTFISPEKIQETKIFHELPAIRQSFVTRKENRKVINDGLAICRNIGFEAWANCSGQTSWNIKIVKELFETESNGNINS